MKTQGEQWQDGDRARKFARQTSLSSRLTHVPFARRVIACLEPSLQAPTIVDLGAGPGCLGIELGRLRPGARIIAVDPSSEMLQLSRQHASKAGLTGFEARQGRAEKMPLESGSSDLVISQSSLHEWEEPRQGLAEIYRTLKPGGRLILKDYNLAWLSAWKRKLLGLLHPLHMFKFSFDNVAAMTREAGFEQIQQMGKGLQYCLLATKPIDKKTESTLPETER